MRAFFVISCLFASGLAHAEPASMSSLPTCAWNPSQGSSPGEGAAACVASGVVFLRENTLPVCDWSDPARSYQQLLVPTQGGSGAWQCLELPVQQLCRFQAGRPVSPMYTLIHAGPSAPTMAWTSGAALYGVQRLECTSSHTATPVDVLYPGELVKGLDAPVFECGATPAGAVVITELDGGTVEHVRPALVRGQVSLRIHNAAGSLGLSAGAGSAATRSRGSGGGHGESRLATMAGAAAAPPPRGHSVMVTLAVQVFSNGAWVDHRTTTFAATGRRALQEIDDQVVPGLDVRLQVRGMTCQYSISEGYEIADARIQVETCIPDQSDPGSCL